MSTSDYATQTPEILEGEGDGYANNIPPGYKFVPNDQDLILQYLSNKIQGKIFPWMRDNINEVDLYKFHPKELAEEYKESKKEGKLYFFTTRDKLHEKGRRPKRTAKGGFWKATQVDEWVEITVEEDGVEKEKKIGKRMSLKFFEGTQKEPQRTSWLMQEYTIPDKLNTHAKKENTSAEHQAGKLKDCVLCKIYLSDRNNDEQKESAGDCLVKNGESDGALPAEKRANNGDGPATKRQKSSDHAPSSDLSQLPLEQSNQIPSYSPLAVLPAKTQTSFGSYPLQYMRAQAQAQAAHFASFSQQYPARHPVPPQAGHTCRCPECTQQQLRQSVADPSLYPPPLSSFAEADHGYCSDVLQDSGALIPHQDVTIEYQNPMPNYVNYGTIQPGPISFNTRQVHFPPQYQYGPAPASYVRRHSHFQFQSQQSPNTNILQNHPMLVDAAIPPGNPPREVTPQGLPETAVREMAPQDFKNNSPRNPAREMKPSRFQEIEAKATLLLD